MATLTNSTLSGNSATADGGGIENDGGMATLTNSTLSGNSATRRRRHLQLWHGDAEQHHRGQQPLGR